LWTSCSRLDPASSDETKSQAISIFRCHFGGSLFANRNVNNHVFAIIA